MSAEWFKNEVRESAIRREATLAEIDRLNTEIAAEAEGFKAGKMAAEAEARDKDLAKEFKFIPSRLLTKEEMAQPDAFIPDQRELRQLLAVKLRALAGQLDADTLKWPTAPEIRQAVRRLWDIAGAME